MTNFSIGFVLGSVIYQVANTVSAIISGGTFDGATVDPAWLRQDGNITLSIEAGRLRMDFAGASNYVRQTFPTEIGEEYTITADVEFGSNATGFFLQIRDSANSGFIAQGSTVSADGPASVTFTATETSTTLRMITQKSAAPAVSFVDNVVAVKN